MDSTPKVLKSFSNKLKLLTILMVFFFEQLFWSNMDDETNNSEQLLIELFPNSVPGNSLWENVTVKIPIEIQTEIKVKRLENVTLSLSLFCE